MRKQIMVAGTFISMTFGAAACTEKTVVGPPAGTPVKPAPAMGTIVITSVTTATTSFDLDPDGYSVFIDDQPPRPIDVNGKLTVSNLGVASHAVTLSGISENCTLSGASTRYLEVSASGITTVAFEIACAPLPALDTVAELAFVSARDGNSEIYSLDSLGHQLRLTNNPAEDIDPAWSPDGKRIAFASDRDGMSAIYVMNADGTNVVRRTNEGRFTSSPTWSPDGSKIAFSTLLDGQFGIYIVDAQGPASQITRVGYDRGWNAHPAWSPDGNRIAFVSDWRAFDFVYDLYSMNADGSDITPLILGPFFSPNTYYFQPAWSPNGNKIAVVVCAHAWDNCYPQSSVAIANANGSNLVTLVNTSGFAHPTWSPDGSTIAYSSMQYRGWVGSILYVAADGSARGVIVSNGHSPSWRPQGN